MAGCHAAARVASLALSAALLLPTHCNPLSFYYGKMVHLESTWVNTELKDIKIEKRGPASVVIMSRPERRNAWTEEMRNEVCFALDQASKDPAVRAVVITGDPAGKAFCAGADLGSGRGESTNGVFTDVGPQQMPGDIPEGRPTSINYWRDGGGTAGLAVMRCTKPVIAAVNGAAVGVGMTFPLCCDMTVAAEDAKVGFVFGRRGLTMECLSSFFLQRAVGHKKAMELVLTGRIFQAKDAPAGLFNYTVPAHEVLPKALELANEIATNTSPMSCLLNRLQIIRNSQLSPEEAHLIESKCIYFASIGADAQEGIKAFLEKRPARFPMDPFKDAPDFMPWWSEVATKAKL